MMQSSADGPLIAYPADFRKEMTLVNPFTGRARTHSFTDYTLADTRYPDRPCFDYLVGRRVNGSLQLVDLMWDRLSEEFIDLPASPAISERQLLLRDISRVKRSPRDYQLTAQEKIQMRPLIHRFMVGLPYDLDSVAFLVRRALRQSTGL